MMAEKESMPNMPRLEMVKVPPSYSSGFSFPSRACKKISCYAYS